MNAVLRLTSLLDLIAAGRSARLRVPDGSSDDPQVRRVLTWVGWVLLAALLLSVISVIEALWRRHGGEPMTVAVWSRVLVLLAMTVSLFYFLWRARLGYWWAYSRLRLFSMIFPVVALVTSFIPGLYPGWLIEEQLHFAGLLIVVALLLNNKAVRAAYVKPPPNPS